MGSDSARVVLRAQQELAREYLKNKETIIHVWKGLSQERRRQCLLRGVHGGSEGILRDRNDRRLGTVCYISPEMNVSDICGTDLDDGGYLLGLFEQRSTISPVDNFSEDAEFIRNSMVQHGISHSGANKDGYFRFGNEADYGFSFEVTETAPKQIKDQLDGLVKEKKLVTQVHGYLVLARQTALYQGLRVLLSDIVNEPGTMGEPGTTGETGAAGDPQTEELEHKGTKKQKKKNKKKKKTRK